MKQDLFMELLESVRQGAAILCCDEKPSRVFVISAADQQKQLQEDDKH